MRLTVFHEAKDSLKHRVPEIQDVLAKYKKELESLGFTQKPYEHKGNYQFKDDDGEAMAYFTDGMLDFVILVTADANEKYQILINLELRSKYSVEDKDIVLANLSLIELTFNEALKYLNDSFVQLQKIEGFFEWILDVTGKFPGIKFKSLKAGLSTSSGQSFNFPTSLAAVGGEYVFYAKGVNKRERIYFQ